MSAGWKKKLIMILLRNFLKLLCWEMDILKRLPGGVWDTCMYASNVENVEKKFWESYPLY